MKKTYFSLTLRNIIMPNLMKNVFGVMRRIILYSSLYVDYG